ncbi:MAG TPA: hypothetical protein VHX61_06790, partial [Rhizomicrobium sp.]|nr:hypothetical protein [Rhizomicrobium sp.]
NPAAHLAPKRLREFISVDHSDVHLAIQRQASPAYAAPRNVGSDHRLHLKLDYAGFILRTPPASMIADTNQCGIEDLFVKCHSA